MILYVAKNSDQGVKYFLLVHQIHGILSFSGLPVAVDVLAAAFLQARVGNYIQIVRSVRLGFVAVSADLKLFVMPRFDSK